MPGIRAGPRRRRWGFGELTGLVGGLVLLLGCAWLSLALGASGMHAVAAFEAIVAFDGSEEHMLVRSLRLPRTLIATVVGAALAVAGALIQGMTRNPLASPAILGINAGGAFAIVAAVVLSGVQSPAVYPLLAFAGAAATAGAAVTVGALGRGGATPERLILAGAALMALLSAFTTGLLIHDQASLAEVRFWLAGSVSGRDLATLLGVAPYLGVGLLLGLLLGPSVTAHSLGDTVARGLGQRTGLVRTGAMLAVVLLAGGAVAVAGPIAFIGLVVPNAVRLVVGGDYRWIVPFSALAGACLLLVADVAARVALGAEELPVGVMTALIGAPVFIHLARKMER
ncbi:MAG: FecCD family ABC transporter permease [bacterium]